MSRLTIRPCSHADLPTLVAVSQKAYREFYSYLWNDEGTWYVQQFYTEHVLGNDMRNSNHAWFLMLEGNNAVGFLKLVINQPLKEFAGQDALELERIYLISDATGKGYGTQAIQFSEDYARKLHKKIIWLKAMDSTTNPVFYNKLGFTACGTRTLYFDRMKENLRGMIVMMKWL